jgi:hypothetical protein
MTSPAPLPVSRSMRAVDRVQPQRDQLRAAHGALEQACVEPDPTIEQVQEALAALRVAFEAHVDYSEGPDGLFVEMQDDAALESAADVDRLRRDHVIIDSLLDRVDELLAEGGVGVGDERVSETISELIRLIAQHRRRGAELLHNVYGVDVGGSG